MYHSIKHAFITPFTDPKRVQIYGATSLGVLGFYLALLTFSYHMAGLGLSALTLFWAVFFGLTGFILMPLLCWIYGYYGARKSRVAFLAMLFMGFAIAWSVGDSAPLGLAVAYSLIAMPYWTAYHLSMFTHSSSNNRANEVAMAYVMMGLGGGLGYLASGITLQAGHVAQGLMLAFAGLGIGTIMLLRLLKSSSCQTVKGYWSEFQASIGKVDRLLRTLAVSSGMIEVLNCFLLPAWLRIEGVEPKTAGGILALQIIVRVLLAPLVGRMAHQMRGQELFVGLVLYVLGWVVLSLPLGLNLPTQVILTLFIWVGATQLYGCGLDKRWYEQKDVMSVGTREMFLNVGRFLSGGVGLYVMQKAPHAFPWVAAGLVVMVGGWVMMVLHQIKQKMHTPHPDLV